MCLMVGFLAFATDHIGLPQRAGMTEPPEAMTRKARDLLAALGHPGEPADAVGRYEPHWEWITPARRTDPFWYRKAGDRPRGVGFFLPVARRTRAPRLPVWGSPGRPPRGFPPDPPPPGSTRAAGWPSCGSPRRPGRTGRRPPREPGGPRRCSRPPG